jgi:hypothetical protein
MPKKELVKERDRLEKELKVVYKHINNMRPLVSTKESLIRFNLQRNRSKQIEKRIREINIEITQLPEDK